MSCLVNEMQPNMLVPTAQTYLQIVNDAQIYELRKKVNETRQEEMRVAENYVEPLPLWQESGLLSELPS